MLHTSDKRLTPYLCLQLLGNLLIMVPDGELSIDKVKGPEIGIFAGDGKFRSIYHVHL